MKRFGHILIVEDSPTQAEQLRYILERNGYNAEVARNGTEAFDAVLRKPPALVISDIVMPEMDGFALCAKIKGLPETAHIPVILLTSLSDSEDVLKGLRCGADNFITKPYDEEYFLSHVNHILLNTQLHRESKMEMGVELYFKGERYFINSERKQILDLLLSTYEAAVRKTHELLEAQEKLETLNAKLEQKVTERTAALTNEIEERKRAEKELEEHRRHLQELVQERTRKLDDTVQRLESSNQDLEQFAHVASHDLQEPLRMVMSYMRLLEKKYKDHLDEKATSYIRFAVDGAGRMQNLIRGLLSYSSIATGAAFTWVNMNEVYAAAVANLHTAIKESETMVTRDELPTVLGDEIQLQQLLQNLTSNAVKYRKPDRPPQVHIGVEKREYEWLFRVRDNGIGIEPQYFERIFQIFQRLHTQEEYLGTGIGLATCKKIIERHGGRIYIESAPGQGTSFYFTLPRGKKEMIALDGENETPGAERTEEK